MTLSCTRQKKKPACRCFPAIVSEHFSVWPLNVISDDFGTRRRGCDPPFLNVSSDLVIKHIAVLHEGGVTTGMLYMIYIYINSTQFE